MRESTIEKADRRRIAAEGGLMLKFVSPPNLNPRYAKRRKREQNAAKCDICGSKAVHWRLFDGSYKLADDQRQHPGNRYVQHRCPTSAAGFEEVTDA